MIIKKIIHEWKVWRVVRQTVKEHAKELEEVGFFCDWIGRIYTVINIPEEIMKMPINSRKDYEIRNMMIDTYIKQQLIPASELLTKLMLSDLIVYPDKYELFEGTNSILIVLSAGRKWSKPVVVFAYIVGVLGILYGVGNLIHYLTTLIK